jgi:hypothetical protein
MIYPPIHERQALYSRLLNQTLLVRTPTRFGERGHSFLYACGNAVVRTPSPDEEIEREAVAFRAEMRALLAPPGPESMIPKDGAADTFKDAIDQMCKAGHYSTLLFEGYVADSAKEHAPMVESLAQEFTARGLTVLRPSGPVSDIWNNKTYFVNHIREFYGPEATPPGDVLPVAPATAVIASAKARLKAAGRVVLKVTGFGGFGNLVVSKADDDTGAIDAKIRAFLDDRPDVSEVRVEDWVGWNQTLCASFFIDENGEPVPLEVCSQLLTKDTRFLGGSSHTGLALADRQALQDLSMPFVNKVAADGMRAFMAVDVILSNRSGRPGELLLPVSGQAVRFVEANLRINGHNQDRLFIAQLAARHGRDLDRLEHLKVGVRPSGARTRADFLAVVAKALDGLAQPIGPQLEMGYIYYVVMETLGEARAHRNDNILFVGEDVPLGRFENATVPLRAAGVLRE